MKDPLKFKPNSGEYVRLHLATTFLLCSSIHNGILLKHSPALEYLYYLTQIGISMSPLHANKLLLQYQENPFPLFFKEGMNVTLCTHNPLHFHYTEEQLLEEYSVAAQIWKLSRCDLCEISKNSILQSGYEHSKKQSWLGENYDEPKGLDELECNIPSVRTNYRRDCLDYEKDFLMFCAKQAKNFKNK
jgi:AMP deaminase